MRKSVSVLALVMVLSVSLALAQSPNGPSGGGSRPVDGKYPGWSYWDGKQCCNCVTGKLTERKRTFMEVRKCMAWGGICEGIVPCFGRD
jgi:hypothetical protein